MFSGHNWMYEGTCVHSRVLTNEGTLCLLSDGAMKLVVDSVLCR